MAGGPNWLNSGKRTDCLKKLLLNDRGAWRNDPITAVMLSLTMLANYRSHNGVAARELGGGQNKAAPLLFDQGLMPNTNRLSETWPQGR